jgi:hypothetical protein
VKLEKAPMGMLRLSFGDDGNWAAVHLPYEGSNQPATLMTFQKPISVVWSAGKELSIICID